MHADQLRQSGSQRSTDPVADALEQILLLAVDDDVLGTNDLASHKTAAADVIAETKLDTLLAGPEQAAEQLVSAFRRSPRRL